MQTYFDTLFSLTEASAERDFDSIRESTKIARRFMSWLRQNNENTPVVDLLPLRKVNGEEFCEISARDLGLPYDDLDIGVLFGNRDTLNGVMHMFADADTHQLHYVVLFNVGADAKEELDLVWRMDEDVLVHELTHYFDRKRQKTRSRHPYGIAKFKDTGDKGFDYSNNPLELNAHYLQSLHKAFRAVASDRSNARPYLESFDAFFRWVKIDFKDGWMESLSPKNKKKIMLRLHKAYEALKKNPEDAKTAMYHITNPKNDD